MKFILQKLDTTCRLVTILNAHIHKFNSCPLKYGSKEYYNFYNKVDKGKTLKPEAYKLCNAKRIPFKGNGTQFKKWVYKTIADGNYVDFSGWCKGMHSFLIADYDEEYDSFMIINAGIYTDKQPVEWLPLAILMKDHSHKHYIKGFKEIKFNNFHKDCAAIIFNK